MKDFSLDNHILIQEIFGAGSVRGCKVLKEIISAGLIDKDISEILKKLKFSDEIRNKLVLSDYKKAENIIKICNKRDIKILKFTDKIYPDNLKNIHNPPLVLYFRGNFPDFNTLPSISIVGPRKPTAFGIKSAFSLGYRLSKAGMIVVSGGAIGCDSAAHKGVFSADGITVLVLGCGLDFDYLSENKPLREQALKNGCVISEYPPDTRPSKKTFPIRNRIVSGLTLGTVVVEGGIKSGALITAKSAAEQGRDVFVIPGNPSLKEYKGSNELLRDGAKPLLDTYDIFNEYIVRYAEYLDIEKAYSKADNVQTEKNFKKIEKNLQETLSNEGKIVYNYLNKQVFSADDLSECGLTPDSILSALTELELENLITPLPGGSYKLI